jgi:putative FmdB family regulatory protein
MPLYEYRCNECNKTFEVLQKMDAEPLRECLYCQGSIEKLISTSSFQLKGSGWYVTDYKNKSKPPKKESIKKHTNTGNDKNATIK